MECKEKEQSQKEREKGEKEKGHLPRIRLQSEIKYKHLVFEGGGVKGVAYAGAVEVLEEQGILDGIIDVVGASAGAIAAMALGIGCDSAELTKIMEELDLKAFKDSPRLTYLGKAYDAVKEYGVYRGDKLINWFKSLVKAHLGNEMMTFRQHEARRVSGQKGLRSLYFIGTNLSTGYHEVFSHLHTPDMPIVNAVRISMAIPLFFTPKRYGATNDLYVDGGVLNNYPITLFDRGNEKNPETLGLRVDSFEEIAILRDHQTPKRVQIDSFQSYAKALYRTLTNVADNRLRFEEEDFRTIFIDTLDVGTVDFNLKLEKKKEMIAQGRKGAADFFAKAKHTPIFKHVDEKTRLYRYERNKIHSKASAINVTTLGKEVQVQWIFESHHSILAQKYVERLKRQSEVREVWFAGTTDHPPKPVVTIRAAAQVGNETNRWLSKNNQMAKKMERPLSRTSLISLLHHIRPNFVVQLQPAAKAPQSRILYDAVKGEDIQKVYQLLEQGYSPDYRDEFGQTPFHIAAKTNQDGMMKLLLEKAHPGLVNVTDNKGEAALHVLIINDDDAKKLAVLETVLQAGADLELTNKFGSTALHRAAYWGWLRSVQYLVEAGAQLDARDKEGLMPIDCAKQRQAEYGQGGQKERLQTVINYLDAEFDKRMQLSRQFS
jgi:NTE family protein